MTFTKETWLGMAGIATLLAYFFWPKKAAAATSAPVKSVAKPASSWSATKPKAATTPVTPGTTPPPYGTSDGSDAELPPYGTPDDSATDTRPAKSSKGMGESGMGESGMTDHPVVVLDTGFTSGTHGIPRSWWSWLPKPTGADLGMWTPPVRTAGARTAGPHIFQGKDYNPTSVWPSPPPMFAQIPGFSDYDLGFDYGKASCLGLAALMMRPSVPSDDWLTGYDAGCTAARARAR